MKTRPLTLILMTCLTLLAACKHLDNPPIPGPNPPPKVEAKLDEEATKVGAVRDAVSTEATSVKADSDAIKTDAESGKKVATAPQWGSIQQRAEKIRASSDAILGKAKELTDVQVKLGTANAQVKQLETFTETSAAAMEALNKIISAQKEELEAYRSGAKRQQQLIWMGVSALAAIALVLGIALTIYVSPKVGVGLIVGSLILAPISYFFAQYAYITAIVGGVMFLLVIGYLIVWAAIHRKALLETMVSFEIAKNKAWSDPNTKREINTIQSNSTRQIVRQLKFQENIGQ